MLNFPLNPTNGLTYSIDDHVWSWNGYAWEKVVQAGGGGTGPVGPTGATGFPPGLPYTALTGVLDAINAAGKSKFVSSNAKFFNTDSDGSGLTGYFNAATRGRLHVVSQTNPSSFLLYDYTSVTEGSSIYTFTGSLVANNGFNVASSPFDTGNCRIFYVNDGVTGAAGATGATGSDGSTGAGGLAGSLSYNAFLEFPTNKTYRLDDYTVASRTFNFLHVKCATGGCSADFYAAGSTLSNTLNVIPSGSSASFTTVVPAGSTFSLVITGITGGIFTLDFGFVAGYTQ